MLRALAETENILKRADRAGEEARNLAISQFAREILTVVDNLERTIDIAQNQTIESVGILTEGVETTYEASSTS
jgi:molecular chaperone GrpE